MKAWIYRLFDEVGEFITSMAIVLILFVPFMWYRFFEFNTLFDKWLPIDAEADKAIAAKAISLCLIAVTLVFMVNVRRLFKGSNLILAVIAFVLNLFFWSLKADNNIYFVIFISSVIASIDYGLPHLFDSMWREKALVKSSDELGEQVVELQMKLVGLEAERLKIEQFIRSYDDIRKKCHCEACNRTFASPQAKNGHKCIYQKQS